jgi:BirA family transcriptional regulator, biotin operon repressor / biotin---[acetyl-CoA-carboxylase] ligase
MRIIRLEETTSTNDEAKQGAREGAAHGTVWVAERQTAGRGRQGRTWLSNGLVFSVLLRLEGKTQNLPLVGLAAGLSVADAIGGATVKWPNDVLIDGKKVAGILCETSDRALVVGIGINVGTHPPEMNATSIVAEKDALLERVVASLLRDAPLVARDGVGPILARLSSLDALRGKRVRTDEGIEGVAEGIDDEGRLIVGAHRLAYGEVHLVSS